MIEQYKTIYRGGLAEIVEKKSRFIASLGYVEDEESAMEFVEQIKKQHWNARHHCWAYVIGERQEKVRCSDDGEPSGTAGKPMLDVLLGSGVCYAAAVVTRYFGGTLLGTGGLVRAYSKAVQEGLAACEIIERQYGELLLVQTDYHGLGKIQYLLGQQNIPIMDVLYGENVDIKILLPADLAGKVKADITEATSGKAEIHKEEELYFAVKDKKILTGDALLGENDQHFSGSE